MAKEMLKSKVQRGVRKAISEGRDRLQSELLVSGVGTLLTLKLAIQIWQLRWEGAGTGSPRPLPEWFWVALGVSAGFALLVWLLRAATVPAAVVGGIICWNVLLRQGIGVGWEATAMPPLLALFLLTFAATRFKRSRKEAMGTAESRRGRRASQVIANLGVAGLCAAGGSAAVMAACVAALAEAAADTVSSEMGQVFAGSWWGRARLITTGAEVEAGTDGGVSLAGTAFGVLAAVVVVGLSVFAHAPAVRVLAVFGAACAGLAFDSLLGATLERKGWLGNDLVNFTSTIFAAAVAYTSVRLL